MGRAVARALARRGDALHLLGRNLDTLDEAATDLEIRGASKVTAGSCDLEEPAGFEAAFEDAKGKLGTIDTVVVTAAVFASQDELEADTELATKLATVNFANTVAFCEVARKILLDEVGEKKTLCVFSSVAGERGRKPVVIYGASKAGLTHYLEGLDHKFRAEGLRVVTVKPGFVKTEMTAELDPPPFAGEPEEVARRVVTAIDRGTPVVYAPAPWAAIMAVIRNLPRFVMRRVGF